MARRKKDPSRKTTYKPLKRGAFARSLASQVDTEGNNLNLLELKGGEYRNTPNQLPNDIQRCFIPEDVLDDERTFKAS